MSHWLKNFIDGYRGFDRLSRALLILAALLILISIVALALKLLGVIPNSDMEMFKMVETIYA